MTISVSCSKNSYNLGSDFEKLIGTWRNINGNQPIEVKIRGNGKVEVHKSIERGISFKTKYFESYSSPNPIGSFEYSLSEEKDIFIGRYLTFNCNSNFDTIAFHVGTLLADNTAQYGEIFFIKD